MMERSLPRPTQPIWRAALLATTGLSALGIAAPAARAQTALPADTTPQGGSVAAGSAAITQGNASTTINQSSARTVIDWQSFNVGSAASVQFNQPSSSAIALNRVMTPSPSLIAGQINANGQLVIINQSGVVFAKGSEVNAESLVVATSNIADKDFMAGNMVFSGAPNPGAKIINDGKITVKDTGLAGFVAPQVENDGVITAKLGQVVLAGASAFTLDLYGDRLISIDVTKAVRAVDVGGQVVAALVTNRGLILANGGTITLTAQDADALVTQLVDAGGTIQANSVGAQAGAVNISGVGGDISIAGNLLARGVGAGAKGGSIAALTTGTVRVGAGAVLDASGAAGGGVVALGTDITRAAQGPSDTAAPEAASVLVAAGARIASNATEDGDGGRVTILSAKDTDVAGAISATGGPKGGDGGFVEISGDSGYALTGTVNVAAATGAPGTILIDPASLTIAASGTTAVLPIGTGGTLASATIAASEFTSLTGNVELLATTNLAVDEAIIAKSLSSLLLISPTVSSDAQGTISLTGTDARLSLVADTLLLEAPASAATIEIAPYTSGSPQTIFAGEAGSLDATSLLRLGAYTPYPTLGSPAISITAGSLDFAAGTAAIGGTATTVELDSTGTIAQAPNALPVTAGTLVIGAGTGVTLANTGNEIGSLVSDVTTGGLALADASSLAILGAVRDSTAISLNSGGGILLNGTLAAPLVSLTGGGLDVAGTLDAATLLALDIAGTVFESGNGAVNAGTLLTTPPITGGLTLAGPDNVIGTIDAAADGIVDIIDQSSLTAIQGSLTGADVFLTAQTISLYSQIGPGKSIVSANGGTVALGTNGFLLNSGSSKILAPNGTIEIAPLGEAFGVDQDLVSSLDPTAHEVILGNGAAGTQATEIILTSSISFSGSTLVDLSTSGPITQSAGTATSATISAGTLEFDSGGFIQDPTAAIDATLFAGDGGAITGNVILAGTANQIGTLGAMALGADTLSLADDENLTVDGPVSAGAITLDNAQNFIGLDGDISATGALVLNAFADISQGSFTIAAAGDEPETIIVGTISAGTLSGSAGDSASFGNLGNDIGTLGHFAVGYGAPTGGSFALTDDGSLAIPGTLTATDASLHGPSFNLSGAISTSSDLTIYSTDGLALGGTVNAGGRLALPASYSASITGAGSITAGTLTTENYDPDEISLTGTNNNIATLSGVSALSGINITNAAALTIAGAGVTAYGPLSGGAGNITLVAPTLSLAAPVKATTPTGTAALAADLFTFGTGGSVTAGVIALAPFTESKTLGFGTMISGGANISAADIGALSAPSLQIGSAGGREAASVVTGGNLSFAGELSLEAAGGVSLDGPLLDATDLIINAASIGIGGAAAATLLDLSASGAVSDFGTLSAQDIVLADGSFIQAPGAAPITAAVVEGSLVTGAALADPGNSISAIGSLTVSSGSLALGDVVSLDIDAPVAADGITLTDTGPGIALGTAASLQALSAGTIVLTTDSLTAAAGAVLTGDLGIIEPYSATAIDLGGTNAGTLNLNQSVFTAAGLLNTLQIGTGTVPISTDAPITASSGSLLLQGDGILVNSLLSATGAVALQSPAGVSESSAGSITAPQVTGLGTFANVLLTNNANSIASLGNFNVVPGGTLALDNTGMLTVTGAIIDSTASQVSLTSGEIFVPGTVTGPDLLYLGANDSIGITGTLQVGELVLGLESGQASESAGAVIDAGSLAAGDVFNGDLLFGATDNSIGTLAGFSATQFLLDDTGPLAVTGPLTAVDATLAAGTLALNAPVSVANALAIDSYTGGITQAASITAATLTSAGSIAGGDVLLTNTANSIGTLGNFAVNTGTLSLMDLGTLAVPGSVTALSATLSAASLDLTGTLLTADTLELTSSENGIAIAGLASTGTTLALNSAQGVSESGSGVIDTPTLTGSNTAGNVTLDNPANRIGTLGNYAFGPGDLGLVDASPLVIGGSVSGGAADLSAFDMYEATTGSLVTTGGLTLDGQSEAGSYLELSGVISDETSTLSLEHFGTVAEPTGTIAADELDSGIGTDGTVALNNFQPIQNYIGTLGHFSAGTLDLVNQQFLEVTGSVAVDTALLLAFGIDFDGFVSATSLIELSSLDPVTQSGGTIATGQLESLSYYVDDEPEDANGDTALDQPGNAIQRIGQYGVVAGGNLSVVDSTPLTVDGTLNADAITLAADGIDFDSDAYSGEMILASPAGVTQSAGVISTGTLSSGSGGVTLATVLNDGDNTINTLASYADTGDLTLGTTGTLEITGAVSAATLALSTGGDVNEIGAGQVTANVLTTGEGGIDGGATLDNALNQIGTLGDYNGDGDLLINDAAALDLDGMIDLGGDAAVTEPSGGCEETSSCSVIARPAITASGPVDVTGTLGLADAVSVTQTGGAITAGALTSNGGSVAGAALFTLGGNAIDTLGPFIAGGEIALDDTVPLDVIGDVSNPGQTLDLVDTGGGITQTGGGITTQTLTSDGGIAGAALFTLSGNAITALGDLSASGDIALDDSIPLEVSGNISNPGAALTLYDTGGDITQTAGAVTTGVLNAAAADVYFTDPNSIGTIGGISASGDAVVDGVGGIAGGVQANNAFIYGGGDFALGGSSSIVNQLVITAGGALTQTGGVSAAAATLAAASLLLSGTDCATGTLDLIAAGDATQTEGNLDAGTLNLSAGNLLTQSGGAINASQLSLAATGALAQTGGDVVADDAAFSGDGITLSGNDAINFLLDLNSTGDFAQPGGTISAGQLNLTASGGVTQSGNLAANNASVSADGITFSGNDTITGLLDLNATGDFTQPGGTISAGQLTLAAGGALTQTGVVKADGATFSGAGITLLGDDDITDVLDVLATGNAAQLDGAINAGQLTFAAGGELTQSGALTADDATFSGDGISLSGNDDISGLLDLLSSANVAQTGGDITAGTLAGTGTQIAAVGTNGRAVIGTLGSFILDDSAFTLNDDNADPLTVFGPVDATTVNLTNLGPITINGPVNAMLVSISSFTQLILDGSNDGGLFMIAGGQAPNYSAYNVTERDLSASNYSVLQAPIIEELNGFQLNTVIPPNTPPDQYFGTVFMITDGGGSANNINNAGSIASGDVFFDGSGGGLLGTEIDLVIDAGATGKVSGTADLHHLEIISAEQVDLSGAIDGVSGAAAAQNGTALPIPQTKYQFNACPIGSVNCIILSIESIPTTNPLENFDISQRKKRRLDKNVQLPGIATHDF